MHIDKDSGLTKDERKISDDTIGLVNSYCSLQIQHPSDKEEFISHIRALQRIFAMRIARRHYQKYWLAL